MTRNKQTMGAASKLEAFKEIFFNVYNQEKIETIHIDLCKDITFAFLFDRKFKKQATGESQIPYKLVSEGDVFILEDYEYITNFLKNYTGNLEWNEEKQDFETYDDLLFTHITKELDETITDAFNEKFGKNAYQLFLIEISENEELVKEINDIFNTFITNVWTRFSTLKLNDVIEKYKDFIYEEELTVAKLRDSELERQSTNAFLYQEIIEEIQEEYDIDLNEIETLTKKDTEIINILNDWAKENTFNRIELIEMCLPKVSALDDYKWLSPQIYKEKLELIKESENNVDDFFEKNGIKVFEKETSFHTEKLYKLLSEILKVQGDKFVTIYGTETTKTYCFDEYNRVLKINGFDSNMSVLDTYYKFLSDLDYQMSNFGTVIVKNLIGKNAVKQGREIIEVSSYEIRAAYLIKGIYTGLNKEDTGKFFQIIHDNKNEYEIVDWNIGNRNVTITISKADEDDDDDTL